jgi:pilus assembly protein Flp/PilA
VTPQIALNLPDPSLLQVPLLSFDGFSLDESGQDLIEYALVAGALALGAVTSINGLANNIAGTLNHVQSAAANATPAAGSPGTPTPPSTPPQNGPGRNRPRGRGHGGNGGNGDRGNRRH